MAVIHGYNTVLCVQPFGDTTVKNVSGASNEVTINIENAGADVTPFGSVSKNFVQGQYSWTADARGWYETGGGTGIIANVFGSLTIGAGTTRLAVAMNGSATSEALYKGGAYVVSFSHTANLGGGIAWSARLQGTGPITMTTCA